MALQRRLALERDAAATACAQAADLRAFAACARSELRVCLDDVRARGGRRAPPRPIRVLVVDDLPLLRRMVARQLTRAGHEVVGEAGTAAEAVARARALAPDVVLLDFHLPDGLGTDVAARLTAPLTAPPPVPQTAPGAGPPAVVFCTGDVAAAAAALAAHAGAPWAVCAVLEKPAVLDRAVTEAAARGARGARGAPALGS